MLIGVGVAASGGRPNPLTLDGVVGDLGLLAVGGLSISFVNFQTMLVIEVERGWYRFR